MSVMQVSRKVDYALRAMIHLAGRSSGRAASVAEISTIEAVPKKFLEKIIQELIHAGLVVSRRGAHGGYALAREADKISFKDVIEAVEGPITLNVCVGDLSHCAVSSSCGMHHIWSEGQRRLIELFAATKLTDLPLASPAQRGAASDGAPSDARRREAPAASGRS
ncbi:MAG TPA: Rrf2 family transcriptional regulator [Candidatus Bathyarchaeia archaeon]|nr:Rrf2 family transcriptional regulator [Candidatus Bathyarchaeia archaeon]